MRIALLTALVAAAFAPACSCDGGGGKQNGSPGNNPSNIAPNNLPSDVEVCADDVEFCNRSRCRLCRYDREIVAEGEWPVMAFGSEPVIAYFDARNDELQFARRTGPGSWEAETAWSAPNGWREGSIQMAVAANGDPWLTIVDEDRAATLVFQDGGVWNAELIEGAFDFAPIAIDEAGTPWIIYGPVTGGLALAGRIDGSWQTTVIVDTGMYVNAKSIHAADGGIWVAWVDHEASELRAAFWDGESVETEVAITGLGDNVRSSSLSIASDGSRIGIAVDDRVAIRDGGTWTATSSNASGDNNVLLLHDGRRELVAYEFFGLAVAQQVGSEWPSQLISTECDSEALDAVISPNGELFVTYWCRGAIEFMERTSMYDKEYAAACRSLTTALCEAALECNPDASNVSGDLCLYGSNGGANCINVPYCETDYYGAVCGDATQDPTIVSDCAAAAPTECRNEGEDGGVVLPEICAFR